MGIEQRRHVRTPCDPVEVYISLYGFEERVPAVIVETSEQGLKLRTARSIAEGTRLAIDKDGTLMRGESRHCEMIEPPFFTVGVSLTEG